MARKIVLLADNDRDYVATRLDYLQRQGFTVHTAFSPSEARDVLDTEWVHIALLDIRLEDDRDREDVSGITLAKEAKYGSVPKIMVTGFPTFEYARDVMGSKLDGLPDAVDFLTKKEGFKPLAEAIEKAMERWLQLNWDLEFEFSERSALGLDGFVRRWEPQLKSEQLFTRTQEMEDLFRRLFKQENSITFDTVFWQRPGRLAMTVYADGEGRPVSQYLVTCGLTSAMESEERDFPHVFRRAGALRLDAQAETKHFAATRYKLAGVDLEKLRTFKKFFHQANTRETGAVLDDLVARNLEVDAYSRNWLPESNRSWLEIATDWLDLPDVSSLSRRLTEAFSSLDEQARGHGVASLELDQDELVLRPPGGFAFVTSNPLVCLKQAAVVTPSVAPLSGTVFSAVDVDTILVDIDSRAHFTDFGCIAQGPRLGEFAALETSMKFDLAELVSILEFREVEQSLSQAIRLDKKVDVGPASLRKLSLSVQRLRRLAANATGGHQADFEPYGWLLFFLALKRILGYQPENTGRMQRDLLPTICATISLGLLSDRLIDAIEIDAPTISASGLQLDTSTSEFHVDGRLAELPQTEFELLAYLWDHAGTLSLRKDVYEAVYGQPYVAGKLDTCDSNLNMLVSRVRQTIEPDPDNPKFLITKRGQGYILYPKGRAGSA